MGITAEYKRNRVQNGIEIYFSSDPGTTVKSRLIGKHWRYNGKKKCWYIYYTDGNECFAKEIVKALEPKKTMSTVVAPGYAYSSSYVPYYGSSRDDKVDHNLAPIDKPLGVYKPISPSDVRYKKKRSFFS